MKFLCDRCKTRYSIGEDRVRGKILKIRCKNCSNVITVREGMAEPVGAGAEPADPGRRNKVTTMAPIGGEPAPKPPTSLEEEWYVSIDGEQSGPYSLQTAQQWVSSKPLEADLHCWSEGFDDWLPVDKVSHFRGLRTRPVPPPPGRAPTNQPRPLTALPPPVPEEVKPLFAATMAAVEKAVDERSASNPAIAFGNPSLPAAASPSAFGGVTQPGVFAASSTPHRPPAALTPAAQPLPTVSAPSPSAMPTTNPTPTPAPVASMRGPSTGPVMGVPGFDLGGSSTEIEAPPFAAFGGSAAPYSHGTNGSHATPPPAVETDDDDDLDIGEVSRVVNLADLAKQARAHAERKSQPIARAATVPGAGTGSLARLSQPRLGTSSLAVQGGVHPFSASAATGDALAAGAGGAAFDPNLVDPNASLVAVTHQPVSHRRGLIALIVGAVLLLGAAAAVVVFVMSTHHDVIGGDQLGGGNEIDTTRPDDPIRKINAGGSATGSAADVTNPLVPKNPGGTTVRHPTNPGSSNQTTVETPGRDSLGADEIESMAKKYSTNTQRCYMRAQRGAEAITIGDVKKVVVTIGIANDGKVSAVSLNEHGNDSLGQCLIAAVKAWQFRPNPGGTYKLTLVFSN